MRSTPSSSVPNASRPWSRRSISRPATPAVTPVSLPASMSPWVATSCATVSVTGYEYAPAGPPSDSANVLLPDEPQAVQGQPRLGVLDRLGHRRDQVGQPAGRDDGRVAQLLLDAVAHAVDQRGVAVDGPGLHGLDRGLADDRARFDQLDLAKRGGTSEQRVEA